jgi:hypothetical protein
VIDEAFFDCPTDCELLFSQGYDHVSLMKLSLIVQQIVRAELLLSQGCS